MKKETLFIIGAALVAGILVGVIFSKSGSRAPSGQSSAPPTAAPAVNVQKDIQILEGIVLKEPGNRNAWVQLGNLFFDADQPMKAVEAYDKALAIDANDPNVLTDQGVMYRRIGWFDKAAENFARANELNPNHHQSLFNLGIVYRYDLQDFAKATEVWEKYLQIIPTPPGADQVRAELEFLKSHPQVPKQ